MRRRLDERNPAPNRRCRDGRDGRDDGCGRRQFTFPNNDALGYGWGICDKVTRGVPYPDVMADVKRDVLPNDEGAADYVVSYAVGILCPAQLWQLRNTAAGYRPPA